MSTPTDTATGDHKRRTFYWLLVNTVIATLTASFVWWCALFWVYLETRSVAFTGIAGAVFTALSAFGAPAFGSYVDRVGALRSIRVSSVVGTALLVAATAIYFAVIDGNALDLGSAWFWAFVIAVLTGGTAITMRGIALSTTVTLLIDADQRDKANGLLGATMGVSMVLTSVLSGIALGFGSMSLVMGLTVVLMALTLAHLATIHFDEPDRPAHEQAPGLFDVSGAITAVRAVPGLWLIIAVSTFNNLLGGVFMALLDAYGLEVMSVQGWGLLWAIVSCSFIVSGLVISRVGLGPSPLRTLIVANVASWVACATFAVRDSPVLMAVGLALWLSLFTIIESAEQTILQRSIPIEVQGRVFGFAQLVENAASPATSLAAAPLAQILVIPAMTDGWGANSIGSWWGTGTSRALALIFTVTGIIGIAATVAVRRTGTFRQLLLDEATAADSQGSTLATG